MPPFVFVLCCVAGLPFPPLMLPPGCWSPPFEAVPAPFDVCALRGCPASQSSGRRRARWPECRGVPSSAGGPIRGPYALRGAGRRGRSWSYERPRRTAPCKRDDENAPPDAARSRPAPAADGSLRWIGDALCLPAARGSARALIPQQKSRSGPHTNRPRLLRSRIGPRAYLCLHRADCSLRELRDRGLVRFGQLEVAALRRVGDVLGQARRDELVLRVQHQ